MVLANELLRLGPLNVPLWLLGAVGGFTVATVLQRLVWRDAREIWSATNDALLSGVLVGIIVWKLTPLVTRFPEIRDLPSRLLYYPGGTVGSVGGLVAAVVVVGLSVKRNRAREAGEPQGRGDARQRDSGTIDPQESGSQASGPETSGRADTTARGYLRTAGHLALPIVAALVGYGALFFIPSGREPAPVVDSWTFLSGYETRLDDTLPTVVTAWATWCGPCTAQMPEFDRFHRDYGERVNLIALNLTATEASLETVREYLSSNDLEFAVALDPSGSFGAALGIRSTPTTIVLEAGGRERVRRTGAVNADWLARMVLPLGR